MPESFTPGTKTSRLKLRDLQVTGYSVILESAMTSSEKIDRAEAGMDAEYKAKTRLKRRFSFFEQCWALVDANFQKSVKKEQFFQLGYRKR